MLSVAAAAFIDDVVLIIVVVRIRELCVDVASGKSLANEAVFLDCGKFRIGQCEVRMAGVKSGVDDSHHIAFPLVIKIPGKGSFDHSHGFDHGGFRFLILLSDVDILHCIDVLKERDLSALDHGTGSIEHFVEGIQGF